MQALQDATETHVSRRCFLVMALLLTSERIGPSDGSDPHSILSNAKTRCAQDAPPACGASVRALGQRFDGSLPCHPRTIHAVYHYLTGPLHTSIRLLAAPPSFARQTLGNREIREQYYYHRPQEQAIPREIAQTGGWRRRLDTNHNSNDAPSHRFCIAVTKRCSTDSHAPHYEEDSAFGAVRPRGCCACGKSASRQ